MKNILVVCLVALGVSGCATKVPVQREVGQLNLEYNKGPASKKVNKTVAVVSPSIKRNMNRQTAAVTPTNNPFIAMALAKNGGTTRKANFNDEFYRNYGGRVSSAMSSEMWELFNRKGFKTLGPYDTFDDITYTDKKTVYLASIPSLEFNIDQKRTSFDCKRTYCTDKGEIQVGGQFVVKLIEPLTKQTFLTKRVNLSDFAIKKAYEKQSATNPSRGTDLLGTALDKATAPSVLKDNTDKVLTEAINEFYAAAFEKIDKYLSTEELMSFERDVEQVKNLKRF